MPRFSIALTIQRVHVQTESDITEYQTNRNKRHIGPTLKSLQSMTT